MLSVQEFETRNDDLVALIRRLVGPRGLEQERGVVHLEPTRLGGAATRATTRSGDELTHVLDRHRGRASLTAEDLEHAPEICLQSAEPLLREATGLRLRDEVQLCGVG